MEPGQQYSEEMTLSALATWTGGPLCSSWTLIPRDPETLGCSVPSAMMILRVLRPHWTRHLTYLGGGNSTIIALTDLV